MRPKQLVEKVHMRYYVAYVLQYFHFCQKFEITIFVKIVNIVAKF